MNTIWPIAAITFKEGLRHRVLYGVICAALLLILISVLISGLFMRDVLKILLDICLSAVSVGGLLVPLFVAVNLLKSDIEKKSIYCILSRRISRGNYILGRFVGLALLSGCLMGILTCATISATIIAQLIYPPSFFTELYWPSILTAPFIAFWGILMLIACVMFWSSVTTSSFLATLLVLSTYLVGQTLEDLVRFMEVRNEAIYIHPIIELIVNSLLFIFPNLATFDLKQQAAHGLSIPFPSCFMLISYSICYTSALLILTTYFFNRKELT